VNYDDGFGVLHDLEGPAETQSSRPQHSSWASLAAVLQQLHAASMTDALLKLHAQQKALVSTLLYTSHSAVDSDQPQLDSTRAPAMPDAIAAQHSALEGGHLAAHVAALKALGHSASASWAGACEASNAAATLAAAGNAVAAIKTRLAASLGERSAARCGARGGYTTLKGTLCYIRRNYPHPEVLGAPRFQLLHE